MGTVHDPRDVLVIPQLRLRDATAWADEPGATAHQRRAARFALLGDNVRRVVAAPRKNKNKIHRADCRVVLANLQEDPDDYEGFSNHRVPAQAALCGECHYRPPRRRPVNKKENDGNA